MPKTSKFHEKVTIVIPTFNRPEILRRTLRELKQRGFDRHPLLIYDDASTTDVGVADVVASEWPAASVFRSEVKRGQAFGRNRLLRETATEWILLLDDDSWPEDRGGLEGALGDACRRGAAVATFQYRALRNGELSHSHLTEVQEVTSFLGGAALLHRECVQKIGGFRDILVFGFEEPDLAFRLWAADKKMVFYPNVIFSHNQHYTPDEHRDYREYDFLYSRNAILMSSLNFPLWFGLFHGLGRSLRRFTYHKRNYFAKIEGIVKGVIDSFFKGRGYRREGLHKALEWLEIQRRAATKF
ncbi:MAG: glycosyltransferase family 2 protein [Verrucomicrobiales bacterium]